MSYVVFALKWRPQNFDQLIGQDHIVGTLTNAIQKNRLAHAYLFAGPRGVGKTSTARILAKALNCKDGPTPHPCGTCPSCLEISKGQSLDVIEIDGASNRGIDEIRSLRESVKFAPTQGKYKVYIIDEVHQITTEGFNALLKTLEEPPEYVKFIFATTHAHKVIPTILSRCQRLDFRRVSVMEIIAQLEKIIAAEKLKVDKEVLFAIARASDGSVRDAESVLDQLIAFSKDKISLEDVTSMLGLVQQEAFFTLTDTIIKKDARAALLLLNTIIDEGKDISVFLAGLIEHFRNLMIAKVAAADAELIDLPQDICEKLIAQAKAMSMEEVFNGFTVLVNAVEMAKRFESMRIPLEISLIRLTQPKKEAAPVAPASAAASPPPMAAAPKKYAPPQAPPAKKESFGIKPAQAPLGKDTPLPPKPPAQDHTIQDADIQGSIESVSMEQIKDKWQNIINSLSGVKMSVATYLNEGNPLQVQGNVLTVGFPKDCSFHKEALEGKENRLLIEKSASDLLCARIRVHFVVSEAAKPPKENNPVDHFLQSTLDMFKGRVIREE